MRKSLLFAPLLAAGMTLGGCATDYYDDNDREIRGAATGAAIGAAAGAGVGAVVEGVDPVEGAIAGAVVGGIAGAIASDKERGWYRDERGYCFRVNDRGERIYDYDKRC